MIYSGSIILIMIGVYLIVNTFRRFQKRENLLTQFAENNKALAQIFGTIAIFASFYLLNLYEGFWSAVFMWFNALTLLLILIVLLNSIPRFKMQYLYFLICLLILFEVLLTYAS